MTKTLMIIGLAATAATAAGSAVGASPSAAKNWTPRYDQADSNHPGNSVLAAALKAEALSRSSGTGSARPVCISLEESRFLPRANSPAALPINLPPPLVGERFCPADIRYRVRFSKPKVEGAQATIHVDYLPGGRGGHGEFWYLSKSERGWSVIRKKASWIS